MSDSYHPTHSRPSGSARYDYDDEELRSQSSYYTTGTGAAHYGSPAFTSYPRSTPQTNANDSTYRYPSTISNSDLDRNPYYHYPQYHPRYEDVPRPGRGERNTQLYENTNNLNVQEAIMRISGRTGPNLHNRSSARQPYPTSTEHHYSYGDASYQRPDNSRKLGMSSLQQLNKSRSPANSMKRRARTDPRHEPYHATGYVGRRSDYDGPDTRSYVDDDNEGGGDEYEEYEETRYDKDSVRDEDLE